MLDPGEREAAEPSVAIPAPVSVVASEGPISGIAPPGAGHERPTLSPAMVMRLQSGAGNAAVSALIGERPSASSATALATRDSSSSDTDLMAAIASRDPVVARDPAVLEETPAEAGANETAAASPKSAAATAGNAAGPESAGAAAGGAVTANPEPAASSAGAASTTAGPEPAGPESATAAGATSAAAGPEAAGAAGPAIASPEAATGAESAAAAMASPEAAAGAASAAAGPEAAGPTSASPEAASAAGATSAAAGPDAAGPTSASPEAATAAGATGAAAGAESAGAAGPTSANPEAATAAGATGAAAGAESAGAAGPTSANPEAATAAGATSAAAGPEAAGPESAVPSPAPAPAPAPASAPAAPVAAEAAPALAGVANGPLSADGVAGAVTAALGGGGGAAGPASAPSAAAPSLDLGGGSDGGGGEAAEAQQGPSEEELATLEQEMEAEKAAPAPEPDEGASLARAAVLDAPEAVETEAEEPMDPSAVAAEAQGDIDALGASGGGEYSGGGGGGGGAAIEAQPEPAAPDVSNADPASAVSTAASLKPAQMLATLGGADQAAANHAAKAQKALADAPPAAMTGSAGGAPADERFPGAPAKAVPNTKQIAGKSGGEPPPPAKASPPPPRGAQSVAPTPAVQPDEKGNVTQADASHLQASIANMPVTDAGAAIPGSGAAPQLILTGAADPSQMGEQQAHLNETVGHATAQGAQEAAEPAGEDSLAPTLGPERLEAPIPSGAPPTAAGAAGPAGDDMAASVVADEQDGPSLRAAAQAAAGEIGAQKQQHAATSAQHRAAANEEIAAQEAKSQADQIGEHAAARAGVSQARGEWTGEQQTAAAAARVEATGAVTEAAGHIQAEKARADGEAIKHVEAGQKEAEQAKQQGDQEAAQQREKAKQESSGGGFFGWVASKATALYNSVRDGITAIFNKVRTAITAAINKARELATSVISTAVKFVADKIKAVASKIVAIGDRLIPGFAALRQKFKTWIVNRVKQAVAALNRIVTAVKDGIRKTLAAVGKALSAAVDLLKKGMQAAIDAVKSVVKAAIDKAKAAIAALGTFAMLVKDIASNPGQWLSNLGAAVIDGIKNHLWKALQSAISQWFSDKVESVLGLGKSVWSLLTKGGIGLAQIGKMAWEALQAAIPPALIAILIEKLVSMIIPAAGAVLAIIQGLQAAWGAVQRILAAIDRFVAFLKAVKSGGAGPAFATAVAAAAVAVIEFVSQFLLRKIAGAAAKIAAKIKAIAQKIGKRLLTAFKKVGNKIKGAYNRGKQKLSDKFGNKKKKKSPEDEKQDKQERLDKAVRELQPKIMGLVRGHASKLRLKAQLAIWRLTYRLSKLWIEQQDSEHIKVRAQVNPIADVVNGVFSPAQLHTLLVRIGDTMLTRPAVKAKVDKITQDRAAGKGTIKPSNPREAESPIAEAAAMRDAPMKPMKGEHIEMGDQVVNQQQMFGSSPGQVKVHGVGSGHYDPNVVAALQQMEQAGLSPAVIRQGVHNLLQNKPVGAAFTAHAAAAGQLAAITRLMFVVEGARNSSAFATSFMAWESAGSAGTTMADVATTHNPMSPPGAVGTSRDALVPPEQLSEAKRLNVEAMYRSQLASTVRYLETLMKAEQPLFTNDQECEVFIREKLEAHLLEKLEALLS